MWVMAFRNNFCTSFSKYDKKMKINFCYTFAIMYKQLTKASLPTKKKPAGMV